MDRSEETKEVTGSDAPPEEADFGSAGNGADPFGADLEGTTSKARSIEDEADNDDIAPDQIERYPELAASDEEDEDEEREVTAQPTEHAEPDFSQIP